jgi:hypothetical protein
MRSANPTNQSKTVDINYSKLRLNVQVGRTGSGKKIMKIVFKHNILSINFNSGHVKLHLFVQNNNVLKKFWSF